MIQKSKYFKFIACVLLILGLISIGVGFQKKNSYYNGDYSSTSENAYVGGDAYNYIINASYFTGYVTLGGISSLGALILYVAANFMDCKINTNSVNEKQNSTQKNEDELPEI